MRIRKQTRYFHPRRHIHRPPAKVVDSSTRHVLSAGQNQKKSNAQSVRGANYTPASHPRRDDQAGYAAPSRNTKNIKERGTWWTPAASEERGSGWQAFTGSSRRSLTTSVLPSFAALCKGVSPSLSHRDGDALLPRSRSATFACPAVHALIRGVAAPSDVRASTLPPWSKIILKESGVRMFARKRSALRPLWKEGVCLQGGRLDAAALTPIFRRVSTQSLVDKGVSTSLGFKCCFQHGNLSPSNVLEFGASTCRPRRAPLSLHSGERSIRHCRPR